MRHVTMAALAALMMLAPGVAADEIVPPVEESTPPTVEVPLVCDPVGLVCVGPVSVPVPVTVAVVSDGVVVDPEGDPETIGPIHQNVTIPVLEVTVPVTVCPNTCSVPAGFLGDEPGGITLFVSGEGVSCAVAVGLDGEAGSQGCVDDSDGDGFPDAFEDEFGSDPADADETPVSSDDCVVHPPDQPIWVCEMDDGRIFVQVLFVGAFVPNPLA